MTAPIQIPDAIIALRATCEGTPTIEHAPIEHSPPGAPLGAWSAVLRHAHALAIEAQHVEEGPTRVVFGNYTIVVHLFPGGSIATACVTGHPFMKSINRWAKRQVKHLSR